MKTAEAIRFVSRGRLDTRKWDDLISRSGNGLIYGYSFYLDGMARQWDALVYGDYEAVMPLTWNRKYGIYYLYQPFLAAQLGVFGNELDAGLIEKFLAAVPERFRFWDFYLNHANIIESESFPLYLRTNYVLDLEPGYPVLQPAFRENIRRNVRRCTDAGCVTGKGFEAEAVIRLARLQMQAHTRDVAENIERFRKLYAVLHEKGMADTYGIFSPSGELLSSAVFFFSHNRAYYILVGNHPNGRTLGAHTRSSIIL